MATDPHPPLQHCPSVASKPTGAWTEIVTLLLMALFLSFSFFSGRISRFLVSPYDNLVPMAALVLLAMGAARLVAHARRSASCTCHDHGSPNRSRFLCAAILIIPILSALWVNPERFSAEGARKRAVPAPPRDVEIRMAIRWVLGGRTADRKAEAALVALPESPTILDLLATSSEYLPDQLEGRFVTILGQCDLPDGAESTRFDLYRLVVTCCIADATAVSVEISRKGGVQLESGGWVRVAGRIKFDNPIDPSLPVIHAAAPISKIPEPSEPYL
jgi:putative membrane protein